MDESTMAPVVSLNHADFPHLTIVENLPLHHLAALSGNIFVISLLSTASFDQNLPPFKTTWYTRSPKRIVEYQLYRAPLIMMRLQYRHQNTPMTVRFVSTHNRWFCEINIAIASMLIDAPTAKVDFILARLANKTK